MSISFVHLHVHTDYSMLDGAQRCPDIVDQAIKFGMPAVAVTDHGNMSACYEMIQVAEKKGINPILGCELYVAPDSCLIKDQSLPHYQGYHLVCLAENYQGYVNLCHLNEEAWLRGFYYKPRVDKELLHKYHEGIIALSACLGGEIPSLLQRNRDEDAEATLMQYVKIFGKENFFLEVQPNTSDEQIYVNQMIRVIAEKYDARITYATDSHYASKDDRLVHKAYLNSMDGEREVDMFYSTAYMMSRNEVYDYFSSYVPESEFDSWTANTNWVKDQIEIYDIYQPQVIPEIPVYDFPPMEPEEALESHTHLVRMMKGDCQQDRYWVNTCLNALKEKDLFNEVYIKRLDDEAKELLDISEKLDIIMTQYYNTMQKIIEIVWDSGNSLVGPARGSATGFLSCYLLNITQVDPVATNLPYWRHLSSTRPELPKSYWVA